MERIYTLQQERNCNEAKRNNTQQPTTDIF